MCKILGTQVEQVWDNFINDVVRVGLPHSLFAQFTAVLFSLRGKVHHLVGSSWILCDLTITALET